MILNYVQHAWVVPADYRSHLVDLVRDPGLFQSPQAVSLNMIGFGQRSYAPLPFFHFDHDVPRPRPYR